MKSEKYWEAFKIIESLTPREIESMTEEVATLHDRICDEQMEMELVEYELNFA